MEKTELSIRYMWDTMKKKSNLCVTGDPGREEREYGRGNL